MYIEYIFSFFFLSSLFTGGFAVTALGPNMPEHNYQLLIKLYPLAFYCWQIAFLHNLPLQLVTLWSMIGRVWNFFG